MKPDTPRGPEKPTRAIPCHIVAIDGAWRRLCELQTISHRGADLKGSVDGVADNEFFLLLWTNGFLCRRCKVVSVSGSEFGVRFVLSSIEKLAIN